MMHDNFGRLHHDQLYRNTLRTTKGVFLDTIEIAFTKVVTNAKQEIIRKSIEETFSSENVGWIGWPEHVRCTVGVRAGYYNLDDLKQSLLKHKIEVDDLKYFYSARLSV